MNKKSNLKQQLIQSPLPLCSNLVQLAPGSHNLSQAKKRITKDKKKLWNSQKSSLPKPEILVKKYW